MLLHAESLAGIHISPELVLLALDHLSQGKKDHTSPDSSRHLCLSAPVLAESFSGFFTAVLRHGYLPDQLKDCVLVPIPKAGKNLSSSDNYCPIALASSLSKVLEWCLFSLNFLLSLRVLTCNLVLK